MQKQPSCLKRGKTRATKSWLVFVCIWLVERAARVFWTNHKAKSGKIEATPNNFGHWVETSSFRVVFTLQTACIVKVTWWMRPTNHTLNNNEHYLCFLASVNSTIVFNNSTVSGSNVSIGQSKWKYITISGFRDLRFSVIDANFKLWNLEFSQICNAM